MLKYFYKEILGGLKMNTEQKPNFYQRHKKGFKIIGVSVLCILGVGAAIYLNNNSDSENEEEPIFFTDNKDESNLIEVDFSIDLDDSPVQESVDTDANESDTTYVDVKLYTRKLPKGHHISPQKQAESERSGIDVHDGETFVVPHKRKIA